jgi:Protein of unknown function (DUF3667)
LCGGGYHIVAVAMTHVAESTACYNCKAPLTGPFCAACGQKAQSLNPSAHDLLHDITHEMLHVDGRIFRSVQRLLFSPGFLTREQFEGRRARWISPLRLYLIFSVIYFGVTAVGGGSVRVDVKGGTDQETAQELQRLGFGSEAEMQEAVAHARATWVPRTMFLVVPLFAWLVQLVSRRTGRNYPQHLMFALHVHAAWFGAGATAALAAMTKIPIIGAVFGPISVVYGTAYLVLAFRRAYAIPTGTALLRAAIVGFAYFIVTVAAVMAIVLPVILWHRA